MRQRASLIILATLLCVQGCALLQSMTPPAPTSVQQSIVLANGALAIAYESAASLVTSKAITKADGESLLKKLDQARDYLLMAQQAVTLSDMVTADKQLNTALVALNFARAVIASKGGRI